MWRVFMCTAGTLGERMWATSEMPVAKKRGSCSAPGICLRNSGLNSPNTVETLTPTFSNTRPRMSDMVPPPRSSPSGPASRCHALRSKRPGASSRCVPESSSSMRSNSPQMRSRSSSNQSARRLLALGEGGGVGQLGGSLSRRAHRILRSGEGPRSIPSPPASATLSERKPFCSGMRNRRSAASCTASGTPALSRPSSSVSSVRKATSGKRSAPDVVSRTSRPGARSRW